MESVIGGIKDSYHSIRSYLTPKRMLIGIALAPVVGYIALRAIDKCSSLIEFYQNRQIGNVDCHFGETIDGQLRNIEFFRNEAESKKATDLYCLAEAIIKADNSSAIESRSLLARASNMGLNVANELLCTRKLYTDVELIGREKLYSQYGSICCPPPAPGTECLPKVCPWDDDYRNKIIGSFC